MRKTIFLTAVAIITMLMSINTMAQTPVSGTVNAVPTSFQVYSDMYFYCAGGSVTILLGNSEGNTISYQLYKNGVVQGLPKLGTNSPLSWAGMTAGVYTIVATNQATLCTSLMTDSATVVENPLPIFSLQPTNSIICENNNASFTATATGAASYQWQLSTNGGGSWNNVPNTSPYSGVTTNTLAITGVTTLMNAYQYRMVATSSSSCSVNSNPATLTVNAVPIITVQPASSQSCNGSPISFTSVDNGNGWQWQLSTNGGGSWNNVPNTSPYSGVTTNTLAISAVTSAMSTYRYRVIVSSVSGCTTISSAATLTVNLLPALFVVSSLESEYCFGDGGVAIRLSSSAPTVQAISYELYKDGFATGNVLQGNGSLLLWGNQLYGTYTVVATNPATTCTSLMTGSATVVENPLPTADDIMLSEPCSDDEMTVTISNLTGTSPWTIQIYNEVAGAPGSVIQTQPNVSNSNPSYNFLPNWIGTENKYFYITDSKGCSAWY